MNDDVTVIVKNRATGYVPQTRELIEESTKVRYYLRGEGEYFQAHRNAPHYGGSDVFTSIEDWQKWDQNFYSLKAGGKHIYKLLHQRIKFSHNIDNDAFGLVFGKYKGEEIIWYAGGDTGFNSYVMRRPKQQLTLVCFSNLHSAGELKKCRIRSLIFYLKTKRL